MVLLNVQIVIKLCALLLLQQQKKTSVTPRVGQGIQQHTQRNQTSGVHGG